MPLKDFSSYTSSSDVRWRDIVLPEMKEKKPMKAKKTRKKRVAKPVKPEVAEKPKKAKRAKIGQCAPAVATEGFALVNKADGSIVLATIRSSARLCEELIETYRVGKSYRICRVRVQGAISDG
jgi:hypothetical protein